MLKFRPAEDHTPHNSWYTLTGLSGVYMIVSFLLSSRIFLEHGACDGLERKIQKEPASCDAYKSCFKGGEGHREIYITTYDGNNHRRLELHLEWRFRCLVLLATSGPREAA